MNENGKTLLTESGELREGLNQIKQYMEKNIRDLTNTLEKKEDEIVHLKQTLAKAGELATGNNQLINKLLGDLSKLQNDIEWYKLTYEKRSFLGTIWEKILRRH